MGEIDLRAHPDICRRCLGERLTCYRNEAILCPSCLGTGNRRPAAGDTIVIEGVWLGLITERETDDGAEFYAQPVDTRVPLPPTIEEVEIAERENARPCESE